MSSFAKSNDRNNPVLSQNSSYGSHPMDAQAGPMTQMRTMPPVNSLVSDNVSQLKEMVGPEAIPDAHIGYEYIAKLAYRETADIQNDPKAVEFLAKFGYSAAGAQVSKGRRGMAMLYIPAGEGGKNPPILAFRGTEPSKISDLLADLDISYVGRTQFSKNEEMIEEVLTGAGQPVVILGHSLGGALAQKTALEFSSMTKEVVTFQSPGLGIPDGGDIEKREDTPKASYHIAKHDLVDRAGLFRIPGDIFIHDSSFNPLSAHTDPIFGTSEFADQREALGISTSKDEHGNETDDLLGNDIRKQNPDKKHIEKRDDYPGFRELTSLGLETVRSVAGVAKTAGDVAVGALSKVGKGIKGVAKGIGKGFKGIGNWLEEHGPKDKDGNPVDPYANEDIWGDDFDF